MLTRFAPSLIILVMILTGCDRSDHGGMQEPLDDALLEIAESHPEATIAVAVVDPHTGTRHALNGDTTMHAASMMKVPVMIEVFRQAEAGRFALEDSLLVENRFHSIVDSSEYSIETDSDDSIYQALGSRMSILDLTRNMITVSSNLATNILIDHLSPQSVQQTVERLGGEGVRVLRGVEDLQAFDQGLNNTATASGLATLFEALMERRAVSPAADSQMIDILLDQQFTSVVPQGLPGGVSFAHKTGWITGIHHDGGIVIPEEGEPYVLVVMTRGILDESESAGVGAEIAGVVHEILRGD